QVQQPETEEEAAEIRRGEEGTRALRRPADDTHHPVPAPRRKREERTCLEGVDDEESPEELIAAAKPRHAWIVEGAFQRRVRPRGGEPPEPLRRTLGRPLHVARAEERAPAEARVREPIGARPSGPRGPAPLEAAVRRARDPARPRGAVARASPRRRGGAKRLARGKGRRPPRDAPCFPRRTRPAQGPGRRPGARSPRTRSCPRRADSREASDGRRDPGRRARSCGEARPGRRA